MFGLLLIFCFFCFQLLTCQGREGVCSVVDSGSEPSGGKQSRVKMVELK